MQAPVTFQKALSFAGDLTAHLWIFSFAIFPSSWGDLGRRDGKCTTVNGQSTLSTSWEQLRLPSGHHTEGFSKSLAQPRRFGASGFCLFLFSLLRNLVGPTSQDAQKKTHVSKHRTWLVPLEKIPPI